MCTHRPVLLYMTERLIVICNLKVLLRAVHWLFPDFAFMWLVEEAKKNMPLELDFLNEGRNAERVARMLGHFPFLKVRTQSYTSPFPQQSRVIHRCVHVKTNSLFDLKSLEYKLNTVNRVQMILNHSLLSLLTHKG